MKRRNFIAGGAAVFAAAVSAPLSRAQAPAPRRPDVVYVPTPQDVVDDMLRLANVRRGDVLYDLGCGDGRIVVTAARDFGARGIGIDIDPERIREANENVRTSKVADRVQIRQADLFETDFRDATVVTLYLLPELNLKLRAKLLRELRPGARIVSHQFDMGEWLPDKTLEIGSRRVYFWTVPARR
jgi:SAM-dependent methyltransferase